MATEERWMRRTTSKNIKVITTTSLNLVTVKELSMIIVKKRKKTRALLLKKKRLRFASSKLTQESHSDHHQRMLCQ